MTNIKKEEIWQQVKKKYRLSKEVILMAKQLGLNPKKFGGLANHKQEPWKEPLPDFIRSLYEKRFGKNDSIE
jgi:Zn-dependent peptidase ImmA (M78 family)